MKKATLAALAMSLGAATSAHAEKPTDPRTELIVNLAVITASVDRCHFEIDSRIIGLDLLKELMLIEDAPPGARYHYNMASALTTGANAVQGAYDEDPRRMVREHVAQLWSRRRNQKGMDYATGRAITGKFDLGQCANSALRYLRYLPLDKSQRRAVFNAGYRST